MSIDEDQLHEFLGRFVNDLGATVHAANAVIGDKLGLYKALAEAGPCSPAQLAERTGTRERYVAEWLRGQAAGGYVTYDAETTHFYLDEIQAFTQTDENNPFYLPGAFQLATGTVRDEPSVTAAFTTGEGVGWHEHNEDVFTGCERFFRPGYNTHILADWIPACDGLEAKLAAGARVADVGCGHGASTMIMATAFPRSTFHGFDYHDGSVQRANKLAAEAGIGDRVAFDVAAAKDFPGAGYDLVTCFDTLHDMGDPVGASGHVLESLSDDGTWMIVEPFAGDSVEENLNPVGRSYYGFSTLLCVPSSLSQEVGLGLGAQAGESAIREVVTSAGFSRFERVAEWPFNIVYAARP